MRLSTVVLIPAPKTWRWLVLLAVGVGLTATAPPSAPATGVGDPGISNAGAGVQSARVSLSEARARQAAGIGAPYDPTAVPPPGFPAGFAALKARANSGTAPQLLAPPTSIQEDPAGADRGPTPAPSAPAAGTSFQGLKDSGFIPPDTTIAAGRTAVLAAVNSRFTIYDRGGVNLLPTPGFIEATSFFSGLGALTGLTLFDPWMVYDVRWKRYIQLWVARNVATSTGYYVLAISPVGTPGGPWTVFALDATLDGAVPSSPRQWADYPKLGYDNKNIYITSNQFTFADVFVTSKIRRLNKADLLDGGGVTWTDYVGILDSNLGTAFTIQPCQQPYGKTKGRQWFINTRFGTSDRLEVRFINKRGVLKPPNAVAITPYSIPPDAEQKDDARLINTNDNRCLSAYWVNGRIYGTHCSAVNFGGGPPLEAGIQWYILEDGAAKSAAPSVPRLVQGNIFGVKNEFYYFPSLVPNRKDGLGIAFTRSSSQLYAGARHTGRRSTTPGGALLASARIRGGKNSYFKDFGSGRNRWGDYSGSAIDPRSGRHVWLAAEYVLRRNKWGTWIVRVKY